MNKRLPIILVVVLSGCANDMYSKEIFGDFAIPIDGFGQTVNGNENKVTVDNIWKSTDGLGLAQKHCQKYNAHASIVGMSGYTGIYKCTKKTISGNKNYVVLTLYGNEDEALPYAESHCNKFNKSANYRESEKDKVIFDCE